MGQKLFTVILFLFGCGFLTAQIEKSIALTTDTGNIKGTLLIPETSSKPPVVLIIAGSGPTDRDGNNPMMKNNSLKMLAEGLLKYDIASVRFDKRGIGESKEAGLNESMMQFDTYIQDTKDWIELLKEMGEFSKIIVLGHSEGSLIGMIASQMESVDKYISVAGAGEPAAKILQEQLKAQPSFIWEQSSPILNNLEIGKKVDSVPQFLYAIFRPSVQPYLISWFKYNPQEELSKLDKPILILQGTTDIQVDISQADKLEAANPISKKKVIDGMNHVLKESVADKNQNLQTYSNPVLPLKKGLVDIIASFINEQQ